MADVAVALEALRSDAAVWDHAADSLIAPRNSIDPLGLTPNDVMSYAAARGLDRIYNEIRTTMQSMMNQGDANFRNLSTSLRKAADMYEQSEQQHKHGIGRAGEHK